MTHAVIGGQPRHLGAWKPSPLMARLRAPKPAIDLAALPMIKTITGVPTDYDQGDLGSCGPNSLAEVYEFRLRAKFSRLFAYYFTRSVEGDVDQDGGVTIPDLLAVGHAMGAPLERTWPYDVARYQDAPPVAALLEAVQHRVDRWDVVMDLDHLLFELANDQPVIFGFRVPRSMQGDECARTGLVAVPSAGDDPIGGHCVTAIGYDRGRGLVRATCHYGSAFGDGGTILLPFAHFTTGNASDLAAIRSIT